MTRAAFRPHQPRLAELSLRDVTEAQASVASWIQELYSRVPFLDGEMLTSVSLTTGENLINHKLDRDLRGWFKVRDSVHPAQFSGYLSSDQASVGPSQDLVEIDTVHHQVGEAFDTSTYTYTAPHTGLYEFGGNVDVEGMGDGEKVLAYIAVNGTAVRQSPEIKSATAAAFHGNIVHGIVSLTEGDAVTLEVEHGNGAARTVDGGTEDTGFYGRALIGLFDQQIGHDDEAKTLRLYSECDRTADLWVF